MGQYFDWSIVLPVAVFLAFAAGVWALMEMLSGSKKGRSTEERLDDYREPKRRNKRPDEKGFTTGMAVQKMLEKAEPLAKSLSPKNDSDKSKLKLKLSYAGLRGEGAASAFVALKGIGLVCGLFFSGGFALFSGTLNQTTLIVVGATMGGCFFAPDIIVWFLGRKRKEAIFLGLPDVLDLLVVCVEAGQGLDQAMRKVADEMGKAYPILSYEFGMCNMHLQVGKSRSEAMHDLGERNGVEDLRTLSSIVIQADKFGSSIAQALRVQSEAMRTRRKQLAEEKAAKTAVKLIFPLVIFIFPGIFVVLVGPAAITMVREMFPMMQASNGQ